MAVLYMGAGRRGARRRRALVSARGSPTRADPQAARVVARRAASCCGLPRDISSSTGSTSRAARACAARAMCACPRSWCSRLSWSLFVPLAHCSVVQAGRRMGRLAAAISGWARSAAGLPRSFTSAVSGTMLFLRWRSGAWRRVVLPIETRARAHAWHCSCTARTRPCTCAAPRPRWRHAHRRPVRARPMTRHRRAAAAAERGELRGARRRVRPGRREPESGDAAQPRLHHQGGDHLRRAGFAGARLHLAYPGSAQRRARGRRARRRSDSEGRRRSLHDPGALVELRAGAARQRAPSHPRRHRHRRHGVRAASRGSGGVRRPPASGLQRSSPTR